MRGKGFPQFSGLLAFLLLSLFLSKALWARNTRSLRYPAV